jgi:Complex 1 protein (LYR family)
MIGAAVASTTANAGVATTAAIQRTTIQLYRDCLRLVRHIAPGETSPKGIVLRTTVKKEFRKNQHLTNPDEIDNAKASAVRALSNYMLTNSARKDPKVASAMDNFHNRSVQDAKRMNQHTSTPTDTNSTTK